MPVGQQAPVGQMEAEVVVWAEKSLSGKKPQMSYSFRRRRIVGALGHLPELEGGYCQTVAARVCHVCHATS